MGGPSRVWSLVPLAWQSPRKSLALKRHIVYSTGCILVNSNQSLGVDYAMEAGLTDHVWNLEELVRLLDRGTAGVAV
jgi:hypothetical protein